MNESTLELDFQPGFVLDYLPAGMFAILAQICAKILFVSGGVPI
jgi:hypothetical protein